MDLFESQLSELCEVFSTHPRDKIKKLLEIYKDNTDAVNIVTELLLNEQEEEESLDALGATNSKEPWSDWLSAEEDEPQPEASPHSNKKRKAKWDDDTQVSKRIGLC